MRSHWKYFGWLVCWLMVAAAVQAGPEQWQGKRLTLLPLPNSSRWVHAEHQGAVLVAQLSGDRLFRVQKPTAVLVRRVRRDGNNIEFQIESEHLGKGKIEFRTKDGTFKLDNKEDMEMEPGETVGAVFLSRNTDRLLGEIQQIRLPLNNVARWVRMPSSQAPDVAQ